MVDSPHNTVAPDEQADLLNIIAQRIEQRERLEKELGVDLRTMLGLPYLAELRKGLEILRRELALHRALEMEVRA